MGQRHILHCDCNCFYASVEMQEHPELRGKSIAVCGDPEARHGIVLTASYPAKRMGVKTGMPIWEAKQHCRDLIIVPASFGKYQKYSGYVREVFNDYTDQVESFGLDEACPPVTSSRYIHFISISLLFWLSVWEMPATLRILVAIMAFLK